MIHGDSFPWSLQHTTLWISSAWKYCEASNLAIGSSAHNTMKSPPKDEKISQFLSIQRVPCLKKLSSVLKKLLKIAMVPPITYQSANPYTHRVTGFFISLKTTSSATPPVAVHPDVAIAPGSRVHAAPAGPTSWSVQEMISTSTGDFIAERLWEMIVETMTAKSSRFL